MHVVIAGGTGFIGRRISSRLLETGHTVAILSRRTPGADVLSLANCRAIAWDGRSPGLWAAEIDRADAVVNLAGENIGGGWWTSARKKRLMDSRIEATRAIVEAIAMAARKPSVLVNASAVGYYGDVPEGDCTEDCPPGDDFLSQICIAWEQEAMRAERYGVRVVLPRTGVVLDPAGGALQKLLLPFRLFIGGPLGSGRQWFPWVHIEDEVRAIIHAITTPSLSGPFNIAAPEHIRMQEFARMLGDTMRRPSWISGPAFVLRIVLGEMAGPLLLSGQKAVSEKLLRSGFTFSFPTVREALQHLLQ